MLELEEERAVELVSTVGEAACMGLGCGCEEMGSVVSLLLVGESMMDVYISIYVCLDVRVCICRSKLSAVRLEV